MDGYFRGEGRCEGVVELNNTGGAALERTDRLTALRSQQLIAAVAAAAAAAEPKTNRRVGSVGRCQVVRRIAAERASCEPTNVISFTLRTARRQSSL